MSQVFNGVLLPLVIVLMLLLINRKDLMGDRVNSRWFNVVAWLTAVYCHCVLAGHDVHRGFWLGRDCNTMRVQGLFWTSKLPPTPKAAKQEPSAQRSNSSALGWTTSRLVFQLLKDRHSRHALQ